MNKRVIRSILFCALVVLLVIRFSYVLGEKSMNRYFILEQELERLDEKYELQVYGSCHAYTSYMPEIIIKQTGIKAYNMANPSEIIPTTYLRMLERFKTDKPKVALVETWGLNAYKTYIDSELIFDSYFSHNLERLPYSREKNAIINDFEELDIINENFPIAKYKTRLSENTMCSVDYNYSFNKANKTVGESGVNWIYSEMVKRKTNYGFKTNIETDVSDYLSEQAVIDEGATLEIEAKMMKYVDKIVELCQKNNVELIFYRSPYISFEEELKKVNYFADYCSEKGVLFIDLEKELEYDYTTDFCDYTHLSTKGAKKATNYLNTYILQALK